MNCRFLMVAGLICLLLLAGPAQALKNVCPDCGTTAALTDLACKKCNRTLNQCLSCETENPVEADYCQTCFEPLAGMRVLSTIASDVRDELRLGESERAVLERELGRLRFLLENDPAKRKVYLFRQAKILKQMGFIAQEAAAWQAFLEEFPNTPKQRMIEAFCSEALRKWGYLFFAQKQKAQAMEKFREATRLNPLNHEAWQWIGRLHSEAKEYQAAGDAYLEALKAKPGDSTSIHFLRGLKRAIPPELTVAPKAPSPSPSGKTPARKRDATASPTSGR